MRPSVVRGETDSPRLVRREVAPLCRALAARLPSHLSRLEVCAMMKLERDSLRVDVPVGFLLPEQQEITVLVDRAAEGPLSIRLRLMPADCAALTPTDCKPLTSAVPAGRLIRAARAVEDDYPCPDYGGGD